MSEKLRLETLIVNLKQVTREQEMVANYKRTLENQIVDLFELFGIKIDDVEIANAIILCEGVAHKNYKLRDDNMRKSMLKEVITEIYIDFNLFSKSLVIISTKKEQKTETTFIYEMLTARKLLDKLKPFINKLYTKIYIDDYFGSPFTEYFDFEYNELVNGTIFEFVEIKKATQQDGKRFLNMIEIND